MPERLIGKRPKNILHKTCLPDRSFWSKPSPFLKVLQKRASLLAVEAPTPSLEKNLGDLIRRGATSQSRFQQEPQGSRLQLEQ